MDYLIGLIRPYLVDLIIVIVIFLVAYIKGKKGLFHSVMIIVTIILAVAIGMVGSKMLTQAVTDFVWDKYGPFVEERFDEEVEAALSDKINSAEAFRKNWNEFIDSLGSGHNEDGLKVTAEDEIDYKDTSIVDKLREVTLLKARLMTENVVHIILFLGITIIAFLLLKVLKRVFDKIPKFFLAQWINHGGGFLLGAIEALVVLLLVVRGVGLFQIDMFENMADGTLLMKWLVGGDIQNTIQALQNLTIDDLQNLKLEQLKAIDFKKAGCELSEMVSRVLEGIGQ